MGFIGGSPHLIVMMLNEAFFFFGSLKQQGSKGVQLCGANGVNKRRDDDFLNGRAIHRHADGSCIMAFEAITQVAQVRFVRHTHPMSTHATADQPLEQRFPFPCGSTCPGNRCLLRMGLPSVFSARRAWFCRNCSQLM